jgi:peroxiredoxin
MVPRKPIAAAIFAALFFSTALQAAEAPDFKAMPKLVEVKDRPPAPEFTLPDPGGNKRSLKDYRGKVVFLAFWASWCEYCREELPAMEQLYRDYKGKGLEIVAVNIKDKRADALAMVKKHKLSYPILMDPEGEIGALYGAFATPTVYLIDRKGTVLARQWGPAGWNSPGARKLIGELVEQK